MSQIIVPTGADLEEIVRAAQQRLVICTPYYSAGGVGRTFDYFVPSASLMFWTRLSPGDWLAGATDPEELLAFLQLLCESQRKVHLGIHQSLHAKLYVADEKLALVGSANLTEGGFGGNFELMVKLQDEKLIRDVLASLDSERKGHVRDLSIDQFQRWVEDNRGGILRLRQQQAVEPEALAHIQAALDMMLGFGSGAGLASEPRLTDLTDFASWLGHHRQLSGAQVLLDRHTNTDGQNLTGHFKQCFFACWRFFGEHPELRNQLSDALDHLQPDDLFQPDEHITEAWVEHVDRHATDAGPGWSYAILRGILPPSVGGTRLRGGGGISTLKRMLPLVARYTIEGG